MNTYLLRFRGEYENQIKAFLEETGLKHIPFLHVYFGKGALVRYNAELWSEDNGNSLFWKTKTRIIAKSEEAARQIISTLEKRLNAAPEEAIGITLEKETA
ncbi:MAG: hypothetical protein AABX07_04770 [Nanoarchaeota archaeon]